MNSEGYTLTETLAALVVLGLAIGGMSMGVQVLGEHQLRLTGRVGESQARRTLQTSLDRLLQDAGPFRGLDRTSLIGDETRFEFVCGEVRCGASLRPGGGVLDVTDASGRQRAHDLQMLGPVRFVYRAAGRSDAVWPPQDETRREPLRSIAIVRAGPAAPLVVAEARIWREQPLACQFDVVIQDCR